ncbi:MAG: zinc-ribbon domain containing protein [Polyangiaceae bacterium]|nr:zinc-ribbon domain containing protein [Polyangiaceae bacterium]
MEQHQDEHIVCATCGTSFLFSAAEAAVYAERNLASPKRCRDCRRARKEQRGRQDPARAQPRGGAPRSWHASNPGGRRPDAYDAGSRAPRYTGDVNEYRSPMPDNSAAPAWAAPAPQRPRGPRFARDDGNYRAPSFGGDRGAGRGGAWPPAQPRSGPPGHRADEPRIAPEPRAPRTRPTFSITCKSCGAAGEVPFKPVEGRDVFCQTCYRARKSA